MTFEVLIKKAIMFLLVWNKFSRISANIIEAPLPGTENSEECVCVYIFL